MFLRRVSLLLFVFCALLLVGGGLLIHRGGWRQVSSAGPSELPPAPDLSRWPQELQTRVAKLSEAIARNPADPSAIGELATLYLANDYKTEAEKSFTVVARLDQKNPRWPYFLATLRLRADDKVAAEKFYADTISLAPDYSPALFHRGDLLGMAGRFAEAEAIFKHLLELVPGDPWSVFGLAKLRHAQGNDDDAIQLLLPVSKNIPNFQEAHLMLADLLDKKGRVPEAARERAFLREGKASPPRPDPWLDQAYLLSYDTYRLQALGEARMEGDQLDAAIPYLQRALEIDPADINLREELGKVYTDQKRWKEAEDTLTKGLAYVPESENLLERLSDVYAEQGQSASALTLLSNAIEKFPDKALLRIARGKIFLKLGRGAEAEEDFRTAVRINPSFVDAQLNLGRALLQLGRREEAMAAVQLALEKRPDGIEELGMVAALEWEEGKLDEAENHAMRLVGLGATPEARDLFAKIELRKGSLLAEAGRNQEAEQTYRKGLVGDEESGQLHGALGMLYGKERRFPEALREFQRYLQLSPHDPLGYVLLGTVYQSLGEIELARMVWVQGQTVARETKNSARAQQLEKMLRALPPKG